MSSWTFVYREQFRTGILSMLSNWETKIFFSPEVIKCFFKIVFFFFFVLEVIKKHKIQSGSLINICRSVDRLALLTNYIFEILFVESLYLNVFLIISNSQYVIDI